MHTKDLRCVLVRHLVNVKTDLGDLIMNRHEVSTILGELVVFSLDDIIILEDIQDVHQKNTIKVICHISSVIDVSCNKFESVPGDLIIFEQEVLEHRD